MSDIVVEQRQRWLRDEVDPVLTDLKSAYENASPAMSERTREMIRHAYSLIFGFRTEAEATPGLKQKLQVARQECDVALELRRSDAAAAHAHEQAAVEAALREAASYVQGFITWNQSTGAGDWSEAEEYAKRVVKVIIDLIPTSSGALDRAIAEARKQALDEAASLVEAYNYRLLNDFESCKGLEPLSHRIPAPESSAKDKT